MRRRRVLVVAASAAAVWSAGALAVPGGGDGWAVPAARAAAVRAAGSWGRAMKVPGLGALNTAGLAGVNSVSCPSAGNCAAGGSYADHQIDEQGFVASQRHGRWRRAIEVPGLGALNTGGGAQVDSVSCGSAGNCAAGGDYRDRRDSLQGFVAAEWHGRWGTAIEVPGLGALNKGFAQVLSVSCGSAGDCAAGGYYQDRRGNLQGFVVSQRHGRWGRAIKVPGLRALNEGFAPVLSVSCGSAGNCAGGGNYTDGDGNEQGFVVSEKNGVWGTAIEVPGLGALNKGGDAAVASVSCASAGNCAAGGDYRALHGVQGFVAVERDGVWGTAIEVPGLGALNTGGGAQVDSVSCASAGNCAAGGYYTALPALGEQGFVAVERDSAWGTAIKVPGLRALNKGGDAAVFSVSCAATGNCAAGGIYTVASGNSQGFVVSGRHGRWGTAIEVPGLRALNKDGFATVASVSCAPAGTCAAGGPYTDRHDHSQGFVVSQTG